jgi:hypothetical protein
MIETDLGPMSERSALDHVEYSFYANNRALGLSAERLAGYFGEARVAQWEAQYKADLAARLAASNRARESC